MTQEMTTGCPESLFAGVRGVREIFLTGVPRPAQDLSHPLCILVGNRKHPRFGQVPTGPGLDHPLGLATDWSARGYRDAFRR